MGLEPLGWKIVFANDISIKKHEMYATFFPDAKEHYLVQDVFHIDPDAVPQTLLATCSFPCIDLSLAGNMSGLNGKHSSAFWGFVRILNAQGDSAPPLILVENVSGWLHSNKGQDFRVTVKALNQLGYFCDVFVLNALRFTPQSRPRVFLIGIRRPQTNSGISQILERPKSLLPDTLRQSILANQDLDWHHIQLPEPPALHTNGLSRIVEEMEDSDKRWWSTDETQRHLNMMNESHYDRVMKLTQSHQVEYRTFFRRRRGGLQTAEVRNDELSGCLRTAVGGSGKQFLIRIDRSNIKMRAMTPREYARLQGVPDQFQITANGVQALTGFGDAVCVPVISWIAKHALQPLLEQALSGDRRLQHDRQSFDERS